MIRCFDWHATISQKHLIRFCVFSVGEPIVRAVVLRFGHICVGPLCVRTAGFRDPYWREEQAGVP